ncbi:hypothetical protein DAPPUDRAFT_239277 [Daphnia pulex]|uniref:Uncharacterized protein n=1 Tax=Daphnia pulex TaxID=6669 RepID=E9G8U9_DAPPU|nr:hypothetical protein DAPPUDRAFT_239277 [Daphnia pulex]|eukprot:EFX84208.1 hypothetical protein DAPPUDRAFT_239277 [Daphnia pulex]
METDKHVALGFFPHFLPSCCSPDFLSEFQSASPVPQRIHRTRSASVNSDRYSVSEGADSKSTPQLLGTMVEDLRMAPIRLDAIVPGFPFHSKEHTAMHRSTNENRWYCAQEEQKASFVGIKKYGIPTTNENPSGCFVRSF